MSVEVSVEDLSTIGQMVKKKLHNIAKTSPVDFSVDTTAVAVEVTISTQSETLVRTLQWEYLFNQIPCHTGCKDNEQISKEIVAHIKNQIIAPHLPVLWYRRLEKRELDTDEVINRMLRESDATPYQTEIVESKAFVVEKVDLSSNKFTLLDKEGKRTIFEYEPAAPFLLSLKSGNHSSEDLGKRFFSKARKYKELHNG